ncbi:hypothetical protein [Plantactinospora sp. CA-290183]|uniref:WXG100-like domain-containing protein n=1 Tax=Plantactinospora sp. CA-290183 TaxID=3240006 RepID=UPI003D89CB69
MDIPPPDDPSGYFEKIKEFFNPWPEDSESVAFSAADRMGDTGRRVLRARGDLDGLTRQVPSAWTDQVGGYFAASMHPHLVNHTNLAEGLAFVERYTWQYGQNIREQKIEVLYEIARNAGWYLFLLPFPGGLAVGLAAKAAAKLAASAVQRANQLASLGIRGLPGKLVREGVQGGAGELGDDSVVKGISAATGTRNGVTGQELATAGLAGTVGEWLSDGLRRGGLGGAADLLRQGLERTGASERVARYTAAGLESGINQGASSPVAGHTAHNLVTGNVEALTDPGSIGQALLNGGGGSMVLGTIDGANHQVVRDQLMRKYPEAFAPPGGTPAGVPQGTPAGAGPDTSATPTGGNAPEGHQATTPPTDQSAAPPTNQAAPPTNQAAPPTNQAAPPTNQGAAPPVGDAGSVGADTPGQQQGAPSATGGAPPVGTSDTGVPNSVPSQSGTTGSPPSGGAGPTSTEAVGDPATGGPAHPPGVEAGQPQTNAPAGAAGTPDAPVGGGPESGAPAGGVPESGAPVGGVPESGAPPDGASAGGAPAGAAPPGGLSDGAAPPSGAGAGNPGAPPAQPYSTVGPAATGGAPPAHTVISPGPAAAGPGAPVGTAPPAASGPATNPGAPAPAAGPANPPSTGTPAAGLVGVATNPAALGGRPGPDRNGAAEVSPEPAQDGADRQAEAVAEGPDPTPPGRDDTQVVVAGPTAAGALAAAAPAAPPRDTANPAAPRTAPTRTRLSGPPAPGGRAVGAETTPAAVDPGPSERGQSSGPPHVEPIEAAEPGETGPENTEPEAIGPNGNVPEGIGPDGNTPERRPDGALTGNDPDAPERPAPANTAPDRATFNATLDEVLPRLSPWFSSLARDGDALVAVTTDGRHARSVPAVLDPAGHPSTEAYQRAVARAVLHELSTGAVRPAARGPRVVRAARTEDSGARRFRLGRRRGAELSYEGRARRDEFRFLADEHDRLGVLLEADLARHGLRRDPDGNFVRSAPLDGQDPRGVLAGALAARGFSGKDLRTELSGRLPEARAVSLRDALADLPPERARQTLVDEVGAVLDDLGRSAPGSAAYLLVSDTNGGQRAYALLDRTQDGRRFVVGYDPQTGREVPLTDGVPDAVPLDQFLAAQPPARAEVLLARGRAMPWNDPGVPESARALWAELQAVEAEAHQLAEPFGLTEGHGAVRRRAAFAEPLNGRQRDFLDHLTLPHAGPHASTVVRNSRYAELVAGSSSVSGEPLDVKHWKLWQALEDRWQRGGETGHVARGGLFSQGIEPLSQYVDPNTGELVTRVLVHRYGNEPMPAEIRFGDVGADSSGARRRATVELVPLATRGGGPAFGYGSTARRPATAELHITLANEHPLDDVHTMSEVHATLEHEIGEAQTLLYRNRGRVPRETAPEEHQPNLLTKGPSLWNSGLPERLSAHDVGGLGDLATKVLQYVAAVDPAERDALARDIVAIRRHLGLDPDREPRQDVKPRWRLVNEDVNINVKNLPPAARRHLEGLSRPDWEQRRALYDVANHLTEERRGSPFRRVEVTSDGTLEVTPSRRPAATVELRVEGARLPTHELYELVRVPDGVQVVRVPQALLDDPARAVGALAPAIVGAIREVQAAGRLRGGRRAKGVIAELSPEVEAKGGKPQLGARAAGQWAAAEAAAVRAATLMKRQEQAVDERTAEALKALANAERTRLQEVLGSGLGLLEGQAGFADRRHTIESSTAVSRMRQRLMRLQGKNPKLDPMVAGLLTPLVRAKPDPDAVLASLRSLLPVNHKADPLLSRILQGAGARGVQMSPTEAVLGVQLQDEDQRVYRIPVDLDLPVGHERAAVLSADGDMVRLRVRPDATRAALAVDVVAELAVFARRQSGDTDPLSLYLAATVAKLKFLDSWHRVAGALAEPALAAQARAEAHALLGTPDPWGPQQKALTEAALGLAYRLEQGGRTPDFPERPLTARPGTRSIPPRWMYFTGRTQGGVVGGVLGWLGGLAGERDPGLVLAQGAAGLVGQVSQAYEDGALRDVLYRDDEIRAAREAVDPRRPARAPSDGKASSGDGKPDKAPTVPKPAAWPFFQKRINPTLLSSSATSLITLSLGNAGPTGALVGPVGPLASGLAYGAADTLAEQPEQQARRDRAHALGEDPDKQRNAGLESAYYYLRELRDRLESAKRAGNLDVVIPAREREALVAVGHQLRKDLLKSSEELKTLDQQAREELAQRRRLLRLLGKGVVVGSIRLAKAVAVDLPVALVRGRRGIAPADGGVPPGRAPDSHYIGRMSAVGFAGAAGSIVTSAIVEPAALGFVLMDRAGSAAGHAGIGQGWALHRDDEVADEKPLAVINAAVHNQKALYHLEEVLALLGDPGADPAKLPAPDSLRTPPSAHFGSAALLKYGPAVPHRVAAVFGLGIPLGQGATAAMAATLGVASLTSQAISESMFRKLAAGAKQRHLEVTRSEHARQLAATPQDLAALASEAAKLAKPVHGAAVDSGRDPDDRDSSASQPQPHAATVVEGTRYAELVANPAGDAVSPEVRHQKLWEVLERRWQGGGLSRLARGGLSTRGIEPLAQFTDPSTGELVTRVLVHRYGNEPMPAEIRFGDVGADSSGARRRATVELVPLATRGGGPAFGYGSTARRPATAELHITLANEHPLDDVHTMSEVHATLEHEIGEAQTLLYRNRGRVPRETAPEQKLPNTLSWGPKLWTDDAKRLSAHDVGGFGDLTTKVLQYIAAVDPADRKVLAADIEAHRRRLGLDPEEDGRDAWRRWKLVHEEMGSSIKNLPPAARRHLEGLRHPGWSKRRALYDAVNYLAEEHRGGPFRRVEVTPVGTVLVNTGRRPGSAFEMSVYGADLPARVPYRIEREAAGSWIVNVPQDLLADPNLAVGGLSSAIVGAAREIQTAGRLRGARHAKNVLPALSPATRVNGAEPRLGRHAAGQWAAAEAAAVRAAGLMKQQEQAADERTAAALKALAAAERDRLQEVLGGMALLEGQAGFADRRNAIESSTAVSRMRERLMRLQGKNPKLDPVVSGLLTPPVRAESDPDAVLASLRSLLPVNHKADPLLSRILRGAGARGVQMSPTEAVLRVQLQDEDQRVYRIPVDLDLPVGHERAVVLSTDGDMVRLRVRPDATRAFLAVGVVEEMARFVRLQSGDSDPLSIYLAVTVAKLKFLDAWHRVAGGLAVPALAAQVRSEVAALDEVLPMWRSHEQMRIAQAAGHLADRLEKGRWDPRRAEEKLVTARPATRDIPPRWMYFMGRGQGGVVSGVLGWLGGLAGDRDPGLVFAQGAAGLVGQVSQAYEDGALRDVLYRDDEVRAARLAVDPGPRAKASPDGKASGGGKPDRAPIVPKSSPWPFFQKRLKPTLLSSGATSLITLGLGNAGPAGALVGPVGPIASGVTYAIADTVAEQPEQQARRDRAHALGEDPDKQRDAGLESAYYYLRELRDRLESAKRAGHLDVAIPEREREALLAAGHQLRKDLLASLSGLETPERQAREELAQRRQVLRLLGKGVVVGSLRLAKAVAVDLPVALVRGRGGIAPAEGEVPPGRAPDGHYIGRMAAVGFAGAAGSIVTSAIVEPAALGFVVMDRAGSAVGHAGIGQGWAIQRDLEVLEGKTIAVINAAVQNRKALYHVEEILGFLGDPGANPARFPAPDSLRTPPSAHFLSVALLKYGPAVPYRVGTVFGLGLPLGQGATAAMAAALGAASLASQAVGEAWFRKLAAGAKQRHLELTRSAHAQQLAATPRDLAALAVEAAKLANRGNAAAGRGGAAPDSSTNPTPPDAPTVVEGSRSVESAANPPANAPSRRGEHQKLWEVLEKRWQRGGVGRLARGGIFGRGVEPLAQHTDPKTAELVTRVLVHRHGGEPMPAEIRIGPVGTDSTGARRRVTSELIPLARRGGGPAFGYGSTARRPSAAQLNITLADGHPLDSELYAALDEEIGKAQTLLDRSRGRVPAGGIPEQDQPDLLARGPGVWKRDASERLSARDVGGVGRLTTKLLQYVAAVDPAERETLARDIEAQRRQLGLDPDRELRQDLRLRWRLIHGKIDVKALPPAARRHLEGLRHPEWAQRRALYDAATYLMEEHPGRLFRRVEVTRSGTLQVTPRAIRTGRTVELRVEGARLPAHQLYELTRSPDGDMVVRVPRALLDGPGRPVGALAPAIVGAVREVQIAERLRSGRRHRFGRHAAEVVAELSPDVEVTALKPHLGERAAGQWAATEATAALAATLIKQQERAVDERTAAALKALADAERARLRQVLGGLGLLEGTDGFVYRRHAVELSMTAKARNRLDPVVSDLLNPPVRATSDPEAVMATLRSLLPMGADTDPLLSRIVAEAGGRGMQMSENAPLLRFQLANDVRRVFLVEVTTDLPTNHERFAELSDEGGVLRLRLRPDATRHVLGADAAAALVKAVRRAAGDHDPASLYLESTVARLKYLDSWHRTSGELVKPHIAAQVRSMAYGLLDVPDPWATRERADITEGALELAARLTQGGRTRGRIERPVTAPPPSRAAPPWWMYHGGRLVDAVVSGWSTLETGQMAGRNPVVLAGQVAAVGVTGVTQGWQDAWLQGNLQRKMEEKAARDALAIKATAADADDPEGRWIVPRAHARPFMQKRGVPLVSASGVSGGVMWVHGDNGALGFFAGLATPVLYGTAFGATDHHAERPEMLANEELKRHRAGLPDEARAAALTDLDYYAAELRNRIGELVDTGRLDEALPEPEREALLDNLHKLRQELRESAAEIHRLDQEARAEIAARRRLARLLWRGPITGLFHLAGTLASGAASLVGRGFKGDPPVGRTSDLYNVGRLGIPYSAGASGNLLVTVALDPASIPFVLMTGIASSTAGAALGQGGAMQRDSEIADELAFARIDAADHHRNAQYHIEHLLKQLGDDSADPSVLPKPGSVKRPPAVHTASILLERHGGAISGRVAGTGISGTLLLPHDPRMVWITAGAQALTQLMDGMGQVTFHKPAAWWGRRHQRIMREAHAAQLAVDPHGFVRLMERAAEAANQAATKDPAPRTSSADPDSAPPATSGNDGALFRKAEPATSGQKTRMSRRNVFEVARKYGIDMSDVRFKVRRWGMPRGASGQTWPDGLIELGPRAFKNEVELARTLVHEKFHVWQSRRGDSWPQTSRQEEAWEEEAYRHERLWWAAHPHNPANWGKSEPVRSGRLPMDMETVQEVAILYGIPHHWKLNIRLHHDEGPPGVSGLFQANKTVVLFEDAFESEGELAKTILFNRLLLADLERGYPFEEVASFVPDANAQVKAWWAKHRRNPANQPGGGEDIGAEARPGDARQPGHDEAPSQRPRRPIPPGSLVYPPGAAAGTPTEGGAGTSDKVPGSPTQLFRKSEPAPSDPRVTMSMGAVRNVASRYGIPDHWEMNFRLRRDDGPPGISDTIQENGIVVLFQDAFESEARLAKTIAFNRLLLWELDRGVPIEELARREATAQVETWWAKHRRNPANHPGGRGEQPGHDHRPDREQRS